MSKKVTEAPTSRYDEPAAQTGYGDAMTGGATNSATTGTEAAAATVNAGTADAPEEATPFDQAWGAAYASPSDTLDTMFGDVEGGDSFVKSNAFSAEDMAAAGEAREANRAKVIDPETGEFIPWENTTGNTDEETVANAENTRSEEQWFGTENELVAFNEELNADSAMPVSSSGLMTADVAGSMGDTESDGGLFSDDSALGDVVPEDMGSTKTA